MQVNKEDIEYNLARLEGLLVRCEILVEPSTDQRVELLATLTSAK